MVETERKVAIVTGAGSGVGRDTALLMGDAGYAVVLVARTEAKLRDTAVYIREEGSPDAELLVIPADVSDSAAVDAVVQKTLDAYGRIDAVANIAGSAPLQPLDELTDAIIDDTISVNLKSVIYMTRAVWPTFRKQSQTSGGASGGGGSASGGAICNVSSMASLDPFTGFNVYAAAKAGVNLFTKATADEGKRLGVTAAAVAPGAIETPMLRENFPAQAIPESKTLDPLVVAGLVRDILKGARPITPGETIPLPSP